MIIVEIKRNQQQDIISFCVKGHANYAPQGEDIVCAAVSVLTQTAAMGLIRNLGLDPQVDIKDGYLGCLLPVPLEEEVRKSANLILEVMLTGLKEIAKVHPGNLKIID